MVIVRSHEVTHRANASARRRSWTARGGMAGGLLAAAVSVLVGCTGTSPEGAASAGTPEAAPTATGTPEPEVAPECEEGPGREVTQLPDLVVPAVEVPGLRVPGGEVDGETVEGVEVPGSVVPAQLVDSGCIIEHDAPGGCLGAVEITGATIPEATIPRTVVPAVELPDGSRSERKVFEEVTVPAVSVPPQRTEQVCQVEQDVEVPTVSRAGVVRQELSRPGVARSGGVRPRACGDEGCVPEAEVETVRLEPVRLAGVDVEPGRLESRELQGEARVDVLTGDGGTSYVAPGDVLFDTAQATIRPDAGAALQAIADQVRPGTAPLLVEGHTDDVGADGDNLVLSEQRARAVADWLVGTGGVESSRVTVAGLGEGSPAFPNDPDENRQGNRRVVVTVVG